MSEFKKFTELFDCRVIPVTLGQIYLEQKRVSEEDFCVVFGDTHYDVGETYYDYITLEARSIAELAGRLLRELYAHGFSTELYKNLRGSSSVKLDYSFLDDKPWFSQKTMDLVVFGDITDANDHRRDNNCKGKWFSYAEFTELMGVNRTNKIKGAIEEHYGK